MNYSKSMLGLLGATAISTFSFPVLANSATEQIGTQSATINGDNNQVIQVINQVEINHPGLGRGRTNNSRRGTVQDSYQGATINGDGNSVYQESIQRSVEESNRNSGRRVGQTRDFEDRYDDDDDDEDDGKRNRGRERDDDDDDDDDD